MLTSQPGTMDHNISSPSSSRIAMNSRPPRSTQFLTLDDYYDHQNRQNEVIRQELNKREGNLQGEIRELKVELQAEIRREIRRLEQNQSIGFNALKVELQEQKQSIGQLQE